MNCRMLLCALFCCAGFASVTLNGQELPEPVPADQITSAAITECPRELAFVSNGIYYYYCVKCVPGTCENGSNSTKMMGFDSEVALGCAPGNPCDCNADAEAVVVIGRSEIKGALPSAFPLGESVQLNQNARLYQTEWKEASNSVVWAESADGKLKPFNCVTIRTRNQAGEVVFQRDLALELACSGDTNLDSHRPNADWRDNSIVLENSRFEIVPVASVTSLDGNHNGD